ncbi:hypothetical protein LCGC14_3106770, partial [marine sediment metagenome]
QQVVGESHRQRSAVHRGADDRDPRSADRTISGAAWRRGPIRLQTEAAEFGGALAAVARQGHGAGAGDQPHDLVGGPGVARPTYCCKRGDSEEAQERGHEYLPLPISQALPFSRRQNLCEKPFPSQIAGALAIESGCIAEMATGEGKTLTCTMPATVAGWRGRGCHIVTVNDYLASRDAEWMRGIYHFCGLSVAHITQQTSPDDRRTAYHADITYCTNKEIAADFLRDRLVLGRLKGLSSVLLVRMAGPDNDPTGRLLQRGLHYAIVDEADSVLIDEAVTPLIISGQAPNLEQVDSFSQAARIAALLANGADYHVDHRYREIKLTGQGENRLVELTEEMGKI